MLLILLPSSEGNLTVGVSPTSLLNAAFLPATVFTMKSIHAITRQCVAQALNINYTYSHFVPILGL